MRTTKKQLRQIIREELTGRDNDLLLERQGDLTDAANVILELKSHMASMAKSMNKIVSQVTAMRTKLEAADDLDKSMDMATTYMIRNFEAYSKSLSKLMKICDEQSGRFKRRDRAAAEERRAWRNVGR